MSDKIDPYVVMHYKGQERKSSVARGTSFCLHQFILVILIS